MSAHMNYHTALFHLNVGGGVTNVKPLSKENITPWRAVTLIQLTWSNAGILQYQGHRLRFGSRHYFGGLLGSHSSQGHRLGVYKS